ncbi:uncharacterized protein LOC124865234 isoform X1 [Girardinichthys multiradiatus]|uniref:uncharacterized protein LOC124862446 isoform X1 n=1 Tax=Girardinichthys multiradiatus TaxID=208333 RepID=UPI001FAD92EF|nr:uncharacterized protein LOC124862446 isoform X1 [Girardinichthys multiradiatus]XP_047216147.1 uncharacterized protein LOC124865234 isoform X1 [Girardinichthys multiradiatus]
MEEAGPGRFAERPIIRHQAQDTPTHLAALIFQAVYGEKGQGFWTPCPMTRYVHDMFRAVGRVIAINNLTNSWSVNEAGANIKHLRHTVCNLWTYVAIFNFPPLLTMKALM